MKKLILLVLGLLLVACSPEPVSQVVERVVQEPGDVTKAIEPQSPSPTPTAIPTAAAAVPTPTVAPTHPPAPSSPTRPPTQPSELPTPTPIVYVVQAGDTLAAIADRFQVSMEAVAAENGIEDVNQIAVGQELTIPVGAAAPQHAETPEATGTDALLPPQAVTPDETAPEAEKNWPGICHPSLETEGARVADLVIGESVELVGYLYVKSTTTVRDEKIVFTFSPAPNDSYTSDQWVDRCSIHAWIPRAEEGEPNHVREYGRMWTSVVILDVNGSEIRGWTRARDSRYVRLKGTVVKPYGAATGWGGSNTIDVTEIELLES